MFSGYNYSMILRWVRGEKVCVQHFVVFTIHLLRFQPQVGFLP
jgi:hypothetical protein